MMKFMKVTSLIEKRAPSSVVRGLTGPWAGGGREAAAGLV